MGNDRTLSVILDGMRASSPARGSPAPTGREIPQSAPLLGSLPLPITPISVPRMSMSGSFPVPPTGGLASMPFAPPTSLLPSGSPVARTPLTDAAAVAAATAAASILTPPVSVGSQTSSREWYQPHLVRSIIDSTVPAPPAAPAAPVSPPPPSPEHTPAPVVSPASSRKGTAGTAPLARQSQVEFSVAAAPPAGISEAEAAELAMRVENQTGTIRKLQGELAQRNQVLTDNVRLIKSLVSFL
jgi:hypothetical protein